MTLETAARPAEGFPFARRISALAWQIVRCLLPYPDLIRRCRVRFRARKLVTCEPWPGLDATGLDAAQLALLRVLWVQRLTRRAVRSRQREASVMLARASVETCLLGLWCLHDETAVAALNAANIRMLSNMTAWLVDRGLVPAEVMTMCLAALGEPGPVPKVWDMAQKYDQAVGDVGATALYRDLYVPASNLFTHANAGSLLRHVTHDDRLTRRPSRAWTRRAPARAADAAVGILAFNIARRRGAVDALFARYAQAHLDRIPPPITVIAGVHYGRSLSLKQMLTTLMELRTFGKYEWSGHAANDSLNERKARLRDGLGRVLNLSEFGLPADAIEVYLDYLANDIVNGVRRETGDS